MPVLHFRYPGHMSCCESSKQGSRLHGQPVIRAALRQRTHVNCDLVKKQGHTNLKQGPIAPSLASLLSSKNPADEHLTKSDGRVLDLHPRLDKGRLIQTKWTARLL